MRVMPRTRRDFLGNQTAVATDISNVIQQTFLYLLVQPLALRTLSALIRSIAGKDSYLSGRERSRNAVGLCLVHYSGGGGIGQSDSQPSHHWALELRTECHRRCA